MKSFFLLLGVAACLASATTVLAEEPLTAVPPPVDTPYVPLPRKLLTLRVSGAGDYRRLYDIGLTGGDVSLAFGFEFPTPVSVYIYGDFLGAQRELGLPAYLAEVGGEVEYRAGRLRIGGGLDCGYLVLPGATHSGNARTTTVGAVGLASVDLAQWGERDKGSVFAVLAIHADVVWGADALPVLWGPSAGIGFRF